MGSTSSQLTKVNFTNKWDRYHVAPDRMYLKRTHHLHGVVAKREQPKSNYLNVYKKKKFKDIIFFRKTEKNVSDERRLMKHDN